ACFMVGTGSLGAGEIYALRHEQAQHGDLLLLPTMHNAYKNLTAKVLALAKHMAFKPVLTVDFLLQLDRQLAKLHMCDPVHCSHLYQRCEATWLLCNYSLPYVLGGGYVFSSNLMHYLQLSHTCACDTVSRCSQVPGWCLPGNPDYYSKYKYCGCNNQYLVTHKQSLENMLEKHDTLTQEAYLYKQEVQLWLSDIYDWSPPPSQCCQRKEGIP
uniref:Uncharacterized protein n=1 Tax=Mustela putorius furo TaxID=9669 RepID=M3XYL9_MUSPF